MKHIVFVLTFASITDRVLPLIEKLKEKGEVTIVVSTDQLERFFINNTNFEVVRTKVHPDLIDRKIKYKFFTNIIRSKIEYRKLFKDIKNSEVYFSNKGCAIVSFSYIKKLSKNNKIIYFGAPIDKRDLNFSIQKGSIAFVMKWIAKWFMGLETIIYSRSGVPFWSLDKKFFEKVIFIKKPEIDKKLIQKYSKKIDILKGKKILIAYNDSISCDFVEKNEFISKINSLTDVLEEKGKDKYVIKPHPRINKMYGKMKDTNAIIPPYIPLQLVLNHDWEYVIGFDSETLVSAVKFTDSKVISLIDAVEYKDNNLKKMFRDNLERKSKNKIKILSNIDQLKDILK